MSRAALAEAFLHSPEADQQRVGGYYEGYLGRGGESAGVQAWLSLLQSRRLSPGQVAQAFLVSDEFFSRAGAGLPDAGP
jgi:hypothetical protein